MSSKRIYVDTEFCFFDRQEGRFTFVLPFLVKAQRIEVVSLAVRGIRSNVADQIYYLCLANAHNSIFNENKCKPVISSFLKSQIKESDDLINIPLPSTKLNLDCCQDYQVLDFKFFANDQGAVSFDPNLGRVHICLQFLS